MSFINIIQQQTQIMYKAGQTAFELSKALEFVGDNSTFQKNRLVWLSFAIFSYAALNSYIPIILHSYQTTLFYIASAIGQLVCPLYFDMKTITKYLFLISIASVLTVKFQWAIVQTILFVGIGFLGRGLYVSSFIYLNEIGGEKFRAWSFMVVFALSGLSPFALALFTMFKLSNWMITLVLLVLPYGYLFYMMKRSWYPSPIQCCQIQRDFNRAREILNVIARENGRPEFNNLLQGQDVKDIIIQHKKYTHFDLILLKALKLITIPLALLWFYRQFIYYGSFMVVPLLGEQKSKNLILLSVSEVVAALMSVPIKLRVKRINAFFGFTALLGITCLIMSFFKIPQTCFPKGEDCYQKFIYRSAAMIIRFAISLIGSIVMNYTIQVFPTKVRNLGFGVCLAAGSVGSVAMPLFIQFSVYIGLSPFIAFALVSGVMIYFIPWLPQTDGKITTERVSQMEGSDNPIININFLNG